MHRPVVTSRRVQLSYDMLSENNLTVYGQRYLHASACRCGTFRLRQLVVSLQSTKVSFHAMAMSKRKGKGRAPVPAQTSTQPQATTSRIASARNPAAAMADDTIHTLWCLVEGESIVFEVTASANASINRLKELIREKGKNGALGNIDAKDLVLLKVSPF